jgi:hypothetical protein
MLVLNKKLIVYCASQVTSARVLVLRLQPTAHQATTALREPPPLQHSALQVITAQPMLRTNLSATTVPSLVPLDKLSAQL